MATWVKVAKTTDVPEGAMRPFEAGYNRFVIAHSANGFFAVANECSHDSAPIADGRLRGGEIMCARHGARFDLTTGAVTAPPALAPIDVYELKVEGDDIYVLLDE